MKLALDALQVELGHALAAVLDGDVPTLPGVHSALASLGLFRTELEVEHGGLGLGLRYGVVACEALGAVAAPDTYRAAALLTGLLPTGHPLVERVADGKLLAVGGLDPLLTPRRWQRQQELGIPADPAIVRIVPAPAGDGLVVDVSALSPAGDGFLGTTSGAFVPSRDLRTPSGSPTATLTGARIRQAAYLLGLAAGAHAAAVRRTGARKQFGQAVGAFQAVRFRLAADASALEATRLLVHRAAWLSDTLGAEDPACALAALDALGSGSDLASAVTRYAVHIHGSSGMTADSPVARHYLTAAVETVRWGSAPLLWREAGARRAVRPTPSSAEAA